MPEYQVCHARAKLSLNHMAQRREDLLRSMAGGDVMMAVAYLNVVNPHIEPWTGRSSSSTRNTIISIHAD